jgi:hypothetical protein
MAPNAAETARAVPVRKLMMATFLSRVGREPLGA